MSDTIAVTESVGEEVVLNLFEGLGYAVLHGPAIAPEPPTAERAWPASIPASPPMPSKRHCARPPASRRRAPEENNRRFHKLLTEGIDVEFRRADNTVTADKVWRTDWTNPDDNDWLVVNQFTVSEDRHTRRPDVVVFINGIPLAVIELKSPTEERLGICDAYTLQAGRFSVFSVRCSVRTSRTHSLQGGINTNFLPTKNAFAKRNFHSFHRKALRH
jgi:type I restriction enzyme R subunit